jgi:hypothetical protein
LLKVKEHSIQKLIIFERKVLGKMVGRTKESNFVWRIKTYVELDELIQRKNIVTFIKTQRLNGCKKKEKLQEFINGSHLSLDQ